uniref:Uncharacterized protein n=1 Tax=uncultured marine virus TaxID=186617 RepID=A0A0F7L298_9VIRU|nr:hypothetical protein [uncultured marine virus]
MLFLSRWRRVSPGAFPIVFASLLACGAHDRGALGLLKRCDDVVGDVGGGLTIPTTSGWVVIGDVAVAVNGGFPVRVSFDPSHVISPPSRVDSSPRAPSTLGTRSRCRRPTDPRRFSPPRHPT